MKEFFEYFNNEDDNQNKIIDDYLNKNKELENKKGTIPNYYYFFSIQNKKMKILKKLFDELSPHLQDKYPEINKNNILIKYIGELLNLINDFKKLIEVLNIHIESYNYKYNNNDIKKDANNSNAKNNFIDDNYDIINNLNEVIKEKDNIISSLDSQKDKLLKTLNEEKLRYEKKINSLERENKIITEKLLDKANNMANSSSNDFNLKIIPKNKEIKSSSNGQKFQNNNRNNKEISAKRQNTSFDNYNRHKRNQDNIITINHLRSPKKLFENSISFDNNNNTINDTNINNNYNNIIYHSKQLISLKALKDFMNELYLSKSNYDLKCLKYNLPKETLEEHMYTFLNKKYGLKNLIIEWARNIINGIKYYSRKDSFVLLFGKILRNEQEEDARIIIERVANSIEELLLYYIKRQNPLKSINEIGRIFEMKKKSELFEEEWKGIIFTI